MSGFEVMEGGEVGRGYQRPSPVAGSKTFDQTEFFCNSKLVQNLGLKPLGSNWDLGGSTRATNLQYKASHSFGTLFEIFETTVPINEQNDAVVLYRLRCQLNKEDRRQRNSGSKVNLKPC